MTHVITGLQAGGAETLLARLLAHLDPAGVESNVISLTGSGPIGERLEAMGVPVKALGMGPRPRLSEIRALRRALLEARPDVVQTWLLHANVLGGMAARLAGVGPVVWGVHMTGVDRATYGGVAVAVHQAERVLSHGVPTAIVATSESAAATMSTLGYAGSRIVTIPHGFELQQFKPDAAEGRLTRQELGLSDDNLVVGHFARFHPVKDHRTLLEAAARVASQLPKVRFLLCGTDVTHQNPVLARWAKPLGEAVLMLGERSDVERLYRALDLMVLSSTAESAPLVVGEAMASGVPCVATRCGDAPLWIGDTGRIVETRDPAALADAMAELLSLPDRERRELGARARIRIRDNYEFARMSDAYLDLWRGVSA